MASPRPRRVIIDAFGNEAEVGDKIIYAVVGHKKSQYEGKVRFFKAVIELIDVKLNYFGDTVERIMVQRSASTPSKGTPTTVAWLSNPCFFLLKGLQAESDNW